LCSVAIVEAQHTSASPEPSGVEGVITVAPVHGGPSRIGEPDSGPLADTTFVIENASGAVSSFTSDNEGRFRVSLAPGHYIVRRKDYQAKIGFYGPFEVDVVEGKMTQVSWSCDSGHR
jgi:hypothetical protein